MRRTRPLQILMAGCQEESTSSAKSTLIWSFLGEAGMATNTSEYFSFLCIEFAISKHLSPFNSRFLIRQV